MKSRTIGPCRDVRHHHNGWFCAYRATAGRPGCMLEHMKTTIHHVARCDDCKRTTVHQSVVEHGRDTRAVSSHHACEPCAARVEASVALAPVLSMITARSVRNRVAGASAPAGDGLGAVAN